MRSYQNSLLAGIAAVAIIAGIGIATAQVQPGAQNGAPSAGQRHVTGSGNGGAATGMNAQGENRDNQAKRQGGTNNTAQNANQGTQHNGNGTGQSAQNGSRNNKTNRGGVAANANAGHGRHGRQSTAQRQRVPHGLQGNASGQMQGNNRNNNRAAQGTAQNGANGSVQGTGVRLSEQQRARIRQTIIGARNAPRVGRVNFSMNVGTAIPRPEYTRIHVIPVPAYLVRIEPRWRGLEYFVFRDEVVIVNPRDLRIVAIVPV
jgi:hypothetical protein